MSEIINRVNQFYTGDFAQIMTGVYNYAQMDFSPILEGRFNPLSSGMMVSGLLAASSIGTQICDSGRSPTH